MNPLRDAFRAAIARLVELGTFGNRAPWVHELARRLEEVGP